MARKRVFCICVAMTKKPVRVLICPRNAGITKPPRLVIAPFKLQPLLLGLMLTAIGRKDARLPISSLRIVMN